MHTVTSQYQSPPLAPRGACPKTVKHSFMPHRNTSASGSTIVAVLRPVLFPNCASSNYTMVQTPHTHYSCVYLNHLVRHLVWFPKTIGHCATCILPSLQLADGNMSSLRFSAVKTEHFEQILPYIIIAILSRQHFPSKEF